MFNSLLEPMACRVARDLIKQGSDLEAVHTLQGSPDNGHRSVRLLLAEVQPRLVCSAAQAADAGLWPRAVVLMEGASLCGDLPVEASALQKSIQFKHQEAIEATQRIERAMEWVAQGRVVSAMELIRPIQDAPAGQSLKADLEEQLSRGERYLDEAVELMDLGLLPAAKEKLDRAGLSHSGHIKLVKLNDCYWKLMNDKKSAAQPSPKSQLDTPESPVIPPLITTTRIPPRFRMNDDLLVVVSEEAVIGNPRGVGVAVPLLAKVRSRQLMIVRNRKARHYQAIPQDGVTRINGRVLDGMRILTHGDVIQLEPSNCQFQFRLPVTNSLTAVFDSVGSAGIALPSRGTSQHRCSRFLMLADNLILTPDDKGHISYPDLPARSLKLIRKAEGMQIEVEEADVYNGLSVDYVLGDSAPLTWPSVLQVRTTLSEVEIIRRCLNRQPPSREMTLTLEEVSQA